VAENTLSRLIEEQNRWRKEDEIAIREEGVIQYWLDSHQELLLQQKNAYALKAKSKSLNERALNEINRVSLVLYSQIIHDESQ
jgi:regulator of sigma D